MFAFQSARNNPRFASGYGYGYGYGEDASDAETKKRGITITKEQGSDIIKGVGAATTAAIEAYKDISIAKITGQAPTKAPSITAGGGVGGTGLKTAGGGGRGGKGLSTGAIVGISAGALVVLGVVGYFVFKKKT